MKLKKCFSVCLALLFVFCAFTPPSHAHSTSQRPYILPDPSDSRYLGGEAVGWVVNEGSHISEEYFPYYFREYPGDFYHPAFTPGLRDIVRRGSGMWRAAAGIYFEPHIYGFSIVQNHSWVETINDAGLDSIAVFKSLKEDKQGHITQWYIRVNVAKPPSELRAGILGHEFGHALGLMHVDEARNRNKIMYYNATGTATQPSSHEGYAGRMTIGLHNTHTWTGGYRFVGYSGNTGYHTTACKFCNGHSLQNRACCIYTANKICKYCKKPMKPTGTV